MTPRKMQHQASIPIFRLPFLNRTKQHALKVFKGTCLDPLPSKPLPPAALPAVFPREIPRTCVIHRYGLLISYFPIYQIGKADKI